MLIGGQVQTLSIGAYLYPWPFFRVILKHSRAHLSRSTERCQYACRDVVLRYGYTFQYVPVSHSWCSSCITCQTMKGQIHSCIRSSQIIGSDDDWACMLILAIAFEIVEGACFPWRFTLTWVCWWLAEGDLRKTTLAAAVTPCSRRISCTSHAKEFISFFDHAETLCFLRRSREIKYLLNAGHAFRHDYSTYTVQMLHFRGWRWFYFLYARVFEQRTIGNQRKFI